MLCRMTGLGSRPPLRDFLGHLTGAGCLEERRSMSEERAPSGERGRWSSRRKMEVVLRALRGEDLDALSRELGVTAGTIAQWREQFVAGGQAAVKSRPVDERDDEVGRLRAKV